MMRYLIGFSKTRNRGVNQSQRFCWADKRGFLFEKPMNYHLSAQRVFR